MIRFAVVPGLFVLLAGLGACEAPGRRHNPNEIDPTAVAARDDVNEVVVYWPNGTWTFDTDGNPNGIRPTVYFVSSASGIGTFVTGPIRIVVSEVIAGADGRSQRRSLHEWSFDEPRHRGFRAAKRAITGYFYGFPLELPTTLDVRGKEVEVVIEYTRGDGRTIASTPKREMAVPLARPRGAPAATRRVSAPPAATVERRAAPANGDDASVAPAGTARPAGQSQRPTIHRFRPSSPNQDQP